MKPLLVTQRVVISEHGERRDALDQRWAPFLNACGYFPVPVPNHPATAEILFRTFPTAGLLLTGGNDLADYGGDAPERDKTETRLFDLFQKAERPIVGVCRGMQVIQHLHDVPLRRVEGHVAPEQIIDINGQPEQVNSYHTLGTAENKAPLTVWATSEDGLIKAIRIPGRKVIGLMWHPERFAAPRPDDIQLFKNSFNEGTPQ